jgi:hypothetical protein
MNLEQLLSRRATRLRPSLRRRRRPSSLIRRRREPGKQRHTPRLPARTRHRRPSLRHQPTPLRRSSTINSFLPLPSNRRSSSSHLSR